MNPLGQTPTKSQEVQNPNLPKSVKLAVPKDIGWYMVSTTDQTNIEKSLK